MFFTKNTHPTFQLSNEKRAPEGCLGYRSGMKYGPQLYPVLYAVYYSKHGCLGYILVGDEILAPVIWGL